MANKPDMSRNKDLAGQSVKQGDYTVTYNDSGMATRATRDGGKSATSVVKTTHANDSAAHQEAYAAAQKGDWDAVGNAINKIGMQTPSAYTDESGAQTYDMTAANKYMQELQNEFGYNANDYYRGRYDSVYGDGAWDGGTGTGTPVYNDYSQGLVDLYKLMLGAGGGQSSTPGGVNSGAFASVFGSAGGGGYDLSDVLKRMKASELEAKLAGLKGAFDKSNAALDDAWARLPQEFNDARDEIAAQNAIQKQRFDEQAAASGLNTGTTGQAELARSSILQRELAGVAREQANAESDINLQRAQLVADLQTAIAQAAAEGDAELSEMLYEEMVRVQNLEREDAQFAAKLGTTGSESSGKSASANGGVKSAPGVEPKEAPVAQQYSNGGLSEADIRTLQLAYGATVDGVWGPESAQKTGFNNAKDAWDAYQKKSEPSDPAMSAIAADVAALGLGGMSATALEEIVAYGGIVENEDGSLAWTPGWNRNNYQRKLSEARQRVIEIQGYLNNESR